MGSRKIGWTRQLDSGLWACTVYLPNGERVTETRELKDDVQDWAIDLLAKFSSGLWIDPRGAKITIDAIWDRWTSKRRQANASRERDHSHWRTWVQPRWGTWPCGSVLKPDIDVWIGELETRKTADGDPDPVGPATIEAAVGVLRAVLRDAVGARLLPLNVAVDVKCPPRNAHLDRMLDDDEADLLLHNARARFPGRVDAELLLELMLYCGLRYGEAVAIPKERVDVRLHRINVGPVMEKDGTIKQTPKSPAGIRPVPVDDDLWPRLRERVLATPPGGLVVVTSSGGKVLYNNWRDRVYQKCLARKVVMTPEEIEVAKAAKHAAGMKRAWRPAWVREAPLFDDPQPTAHDLRHTYGTRLAEANVPPHEIMALMGHENLESVQRYLHARDERHDRAKVAMQSRRKRAST